MWDHTVLPATYTDECAPWPRNAAASLNEHVHSDRVPARRFFSVPGNHTPDSHASGATAFNMQWTKK